VLLVPLCKPSFDSLGWRSACDPSLHEAGLEFGSVKNFEKSEFERRKKPRTREHDAFHVIRNTTISSIQLNDSLDLAPTMNRTTSDKQL
jgi:hypothetical protein